MLRRLFGDADVRLVRAGIEVVHSVLNRSADAFITLNQVRQLIVIHTYTMTEVSTLSPNLATPRS